MISGERGAMFQFPNENQASLRGAMGTGRYSFPLDPSGNAPSGMLQVSLRGAMGKGR